MSGLPSTNATPITDKRQLVEYIEEGCKPRADWRIGTEHEKFVFDAEDLSPIPYEGENGIRALLEGLLPKGWKPVEDDGNLIGLEDGAGASVSLEPGGQLELSGAPLETIHQTCDEVHTHLDHVKEICERLGLRMLGLGFHPTAKREDIPWMPKRRYAIMRRYMPTKGALGLDMMLRTCTVQTNLDFASEADMAMKMRVSLALQPIATALFANSPFTEGKPNGFLSYRSQVWTDTDPDRTGDLPFVFEEGFGFERYVDYMLDVPMYFVYRDDYVDVAGASFRDFMAGRLDALPGEVPVLSDWSDHLTTAFPEVRLKRFIEMRGADGGPWRRLCALPALWVGLLYDDTALNAAWDLVRDWTAEERAQLRADAPRLALKTPFRNGTVQDLALRVLEIAEAGLDARARRDGFGASEAHFLKTLWSIARSGETPAEELLRRVESEWDGDVAPIFKHYAY